MRIHEGDFAYDLEQPVDPLTQLRSKWRFTVYKIRPAEHKLASGEADTREAAEIKARAALAKIQGAGGTQAA
jgi:hypothetical protein